MAFPSIRLAAGKKEEGEGRKYPKIPLHCPLSFSLSLPGTLPACLHQIINKNNSSNPNGSGRMLPEGESAAWREEEEEEEGGEKN